MTRETRIGLLLGLMFIVLFGLVLTNLLGTEAPLPPSRLPVIDTSPYAWTPVVREVPPPYGQREALATRNGGEALPAAGYAQRARVEASWAPPAPVVAAPGRGGQEASRARPPAPQPPGGPIQPPPRRHVYTVRANDNLIKIARAVYGPSHGQQYKRIYEANRGILPDESTLVIGQELVIPPLSGQVRDRLQPSDGPTAGSGGPPTDGRPRAGVVALAAGGPAPGAEQDEPSGTMDLDELRRRFSAAPPAPRASGRVYVVRQGDCLTGIARRLMNDDSPAAVMRIYNANRDKLRSPHDLPVGVTLHIPG